MDNVDVVVIGAGVIGLAMARALAYRGRDVLILEARGAFGTEISSRNSEVIHAGIYYAPGSLKARFCVTGRDLLYEFCARNDVGHRRCGKLLVAVNDRQLEELGKIASTALTNGVALDVLSRSEALALEPELTCVGALYSAATGIIDSHAYMLALLGQAEARGTTLLCGSRVTGMWVSPDIAGARDLAPTAHANAAGARNPAATAHANATGAPGVLLAINDSPPALRARTVINCAGLYAPHVARSIDGFPREHVPTAHFVKGSYFTLAGRSPFTRLVYPIPEHGGLGVHLTLDLAGRARFGPDVEWVDTCDYAVDPQRSELFYAAIRKYWPGLPDGALQPGYAGIRPKITGPNEAAADFRIDGPSVHGVPGIVNLFGIESPGLTASLAIAEYVAELAED